MSNIKGYFITAVIAMSFGSAGAFAITENLYARTLAAINNAGNPSVMVSSTSKGEGYIGVFEPKSERKLVLSSRALSVTDDKGDIRIIIGVNKNRASISFIREDGSIGKIITDNDY